jgi:serine/threonine protein kinase
MLEALEGLSYLHERNIIHRDIKGDNLLLAADMRICIADFGVATVNDPSNQSSEVEVVGTPYWCTCLL